MQSIDEAASDFLSSRRIAVTGVSREPKGNGANNVYKRLRSRGYEVFAVNPNAERAEGDECFRSLTDIRDGVDAVVIATGPERAESTVRECNDLGIKKVWMHRGPGTGSVCSDATVYGREHGMTVIDGGCPLMFGPTADVMHRVMKFMFTLTGKVPKQV